MLIRTISGACYVAIITAFFLLRNLVDERIFQVFLYFLSFVGTFEIARAVKDRIGKTFYILSLVFAGLLMPAYALAEYILFPTYGYLVAINLTVIFILPVIITAYVKPLSNSVYLPFLYPAVFIICMAKLNDLSFGFIGLLLVFIIPAFADTFAYLTGMITQKIMKGQAKKMCPKLSPKKTWAGAIGGTIGGAVGALIIYFVLTPTINFFSPVLYFILIGLVASVFSVFGDLFESYIKRKVGIKDMGNIMPGHGGVMDRIDGVSFISPIILFALLIV